VIKSFSSEFGGEGSQLLLNLYLYSQLQLWQYFVISVTSLMVQGRQVLMLAMTSVLSKVMLCFCLCGVFNYCYLLVFQPGVSDVFQSPGRYVAAHSANVCLGT
jgi:hypothetical protein